MVTRLAGMPIAGHSRPEVLKEERIVDRLLTVDDAAAILGTTARFPRRLIAERRIRFVRVGRHVRIPESEIAELIAAGTVNPIRLYPSRRA